MNRKLGSLGIFVLCTSCAGASGPSAADEQSEAEALAADEVTGTEVAFDDPNPGPDPCLDADECGDAVSIASDVQVESDVELGAAHRPTAYVTGAHLLVLTYAPFHSAPSTTSSVLTSVAPQGGVPHDGTHLWGQPKGYITPGQVAVLASPAPRNGYWEVDYGGKRGWILGKKVTIANKTMDPVDYALQPAVRNAFFKHQLHRNMWNKDGPSSSGNCAPTSLAMAVHVFAKEPTGESIEESIHRVRLSYGLHTDHSSTSRLEIHAAALKLGLNVQDLATDVSPSAALTRLEGQLAKKRGVVLQGIPGQAGAAPTLYQRAFDRAYAAAIKRGEILHDRTYTFDGTHSIFVLGRDAGGGFVVGDPMSEVGFVTLTAAEMKDFMTRWARNHGTGTAVWR